VHSGPRLTVLSATAAAALLLGTTGCTDLDQASAAGISHDDLLSEMSIQLSRVTGLTYSATYQLSGGGTATVTQAQKPSRTAYVYPGGRQIQTATGTIRCTGDGPAAGTGSASPSSAAGGNPSSAAGGNPSSAAGSNPSGAAGGNPSRAGGGNPSGAATGNPSRAASGNPSRAGGTAGGNPSDAAGGNPNGTTGGNSGTTGGKFLTCIETQPTPATAAPLAGSTLITPEAALAMLNAAALDQHVDATQRDTTIAGRHAICLDLDNVDGAPTRRFSLCVTNEGALGSFAATIADTHYEQALTTYSEKAAPDAFDLPPSAKLTDKRPR